MIRRKTQSHPRETPGRIVLRTEQTCPAVLYTFIWLKSLAGLELGIMHNIKLTFAAHFAFLRHGVTTKPASPLMA